MQHKLGNWYTLGHGMMTKTVYILATAPQSWAVLINAKTGRRWRAPLEVEDINKLTEEDWLEIIGDEAIWELVRGYENEA
jgi:hypothetical protein